MSSWSDPTPAVASAWADCGVDVDSEFARCIPLAPTLRSLSPASGAQGDTVPVELVGTGFTADASVQVSGAGITVQNLVVVDDRHITADLVIDPTAVIG